MNVYERPFAERLQAEVERIPLPPRERWTPRGRSRLPILPAVVGLVALALSVLVAAPLLRALESRDGIGGAAPSSQALSGGAPSSCGTTSSQTTATACSLVPGTLVEIVGYDGALMASTPLVRVRFENKKLSDQFGDPALFEANAGTEIQPEAPTIAATGVKSGARVLVSFDPRLPKTSAGAFSLTRFVVVRSGELPDCLVVLDIARFPSGATDPTSGPTPAAALRKANPTLGPFTELPMGKDPKAPVWIVAGNETYVATILSDGTWFVSPAKFLRCRDPQEVRWIGQPTGTATPRVPAASIAPIPLDQVTPKDVAAGMPAGAAIFARTDPVCIREADGKTYRCLLTSAPAPEITNFLGTKEPLVIGGVVAGGCVGLDRDGITWNCFLGQDAVDQRIIDKNFLGQPAPVPSRG